MFEEITKIVGREEGTTSIILVGVHGDEKCGMEALEKILQFIKSKKKPEKSISLRKNL